MAVSESAVREHLTSLVAADLLRRGLKVQARARRLLDGDAEHPRRVDSGLLRSSVRVDPTTWRGQPAVRVGTNDKKARLVHDGTGIYGPRGARIVPRTKRALAFPGGRYGRKKIVVRSVAGMRPNRFLSDALPAARD